MKGRSQPTQPRVVLTIGHSTRTVEELIQLLEGQDVRRLVDVRTIPRSRHNPQFNAEELASALKAARIGYLHKAGLGGLRHPHKDSINTGWRNLSFRGYADYMQSDEFRKNLEELIDLAQQERIAVMCAEALPWRCHRSLIGDALVVRGIRVEDILGKGQTHPHTLTPWAQVEGVQITYPRRFEYFASH
ncbi:MAG: DUF488 domain-containing protein [Acidobacteriia bacterium]|nr:DUF488 domain-containing protein [Terriglobia bacterium]